MQNSKKKSHIIMAAMVLIGLSLACGPNAVPTLDPNAIETAIHQTMISNTVIALETKQAAQQSQGDQQQQGQQQPAATVTHTIAVTTVTPSLTPLPTDTPIPTNTPLPTNTFTPAVPIVSVSVDTNCRIGPGKEYDLLGALLVGEQAEIIARDPSGYYWYIKNPDQGGFCWLWGKYATVAGNTNNLPIFTPPPTPTFTPTPTPEITFSVLVNEIEGCVGWEVEFKLTNIGSAIFQSLSTITTDTVTSQTVTTTADVFEERNGCLVASSKLDLDPGDTGYTVGGVLVNDPAGHNIDATVKLCTGPGLTGTCITKTFNFTP